MRNKSNETPSIWLNGSWVDSVEGVKAGIFNHFQNHFDAVHSCKPSLGLDLFSKKLRVVENSFLTRPFVENEIKQAIWSIDINSSPGALTLTAVLDPMGLPLASLGIVGILLKVISFK